MSTVVAPPVLAGDWDSLSVPEGYRAEIIRGELVVTPAASVDHGRVQVRLAVILASLAPPDYEPISGVEWRLDAGGVVAMAPQPDLMVVPRSARGLSIDRPPLLAVEILSPSDSQRLANGMTRREGKLADYAVNGLADYLEIDLVTPGPVATRYELRDGVLVPTGIAGGTTLLLATRPFVYEFAPSALLD